jgi:hypothetical protein
MPIPGKLGVKEFKFDMRIPYLGKYLVNLPDPPLVVDWTKGQLSWGMMYNDKLGDCTCAALGHQEQIWTLNSSSSEFTPTDYDVLELYENTCGYDPNDPSTDQGGIPLDILKQWYKTPRLFAGRSLEGFAPFNPASIRAMHCSLAYLGSAYIALNLPRAIEDMGDVWDVPPEGTRGDGAPGSLGGHMVAGAAYDKASNMYKVISWGAIYKLTQAFMDAYCIQAFGLISKDWVETSGKTPSGLDLNQMAIDLAAIENLID